jgi:hypothetical protein
MSLSLFFKWRISRLGRERPALDALRLRSSARIPRGRGRVAGVRTPVCYQRAGLPDADACTSGFEGSKYTVRPRVPKRLFFGYEDV